MFYSYIFQYLNLLLLIQIFKGPSKISYIMNTLISQYIRTLTVVVLYRYFSG